MTARVATLRLWSAATAVVTALAGVTVFWLAVRLPSIGSQDIGGVAAALPFVIGMVLLATAGAVLVHQQPWSAIGWLLLAAGAAGVLARLVLAAAVLSHTDGHPSAAVLGWLTNWAWVPAQALAVQLILRFPDGSLPGRRWRPVEWTLWLWAALTVAITAVLPGDLGAEQLAPLQNPFGVESARLLLEGAVGVLFVVAPGLVVAAVAAPAARWRTASPDQRRQLVAVVLALLLIAAAAPLALVTDTGEVVEGLAWLLLPGALAFAVLRRRLWDLDLRRRFDRLRLVREEERSRLQRDLHDSLGPLLGSIAMRVEAAHNLVASGADRADVEPVLQAVAADTESASIEIRRILQELGPSALAERDLTSALQEMVERHPGAPRVTLVLPHVLPRLDPASEIAAYRIVSEALLNVVRHADAEHCRVTVTVVGRDLVLEVRDDGSGLAGATAGVGRRAMADRAAAVGGTLQVADSADGGVVVSAVLPEAAR